MRTLGLATELHVVAPEPNGVMKAAHAAFTAPRVSVCTTHVVVSNGNVAHRRVASRFVKSWNGSSTAVASNPQFPFLREENARRVIPPRALRPRQ